jgi:hypothetical protein
MSTTDAAILVVALGATWAMTGVIWVIQLVHYPSFDAIERGADDADWVVFGDRHRRSISYVVGPFMAAEGVTGLWLALDPPADLGRALPLVALVLMAIAYGVTAFVSAPLHMRLADRYDADLVRRLVSTNWIRTAAWTSRAVVLSILAVAAVT